MNFFLNELLPDQRNANWIATSAVTFRLQRHADHHLASSRPYQVRTCTSIAMLSWGNVKAWRCSGGACRFFEMDKMHCCSERHLLQRGPGRAPAAAHPHLRSRAGVVRCAGAQGCRRGAAAAGKLPGHGHPGERASSGAVWEN